MNAAADPAALLAVPPPSQQPRLSLVPEGYAQKAMASLMQLHTELMDEKERRVELHRQLMEKEQALAELRMYVKLLEERMEETPPPRPRAQPVPLKAVPRAAPPPPPAARPVSAPAADATDGWRSW
jgi:hypothetical protein